MPRRKKKSEKNEKNNEKDNEDSYIHEINSHEFKFSQKPSLISDSEQASQIVQEESQQSQVVQEESQVVQEESQVVQEESQVVQEESQQPSLVVQEESQQPSLVVQEESQQSQVVQEESQVVQEESQIVQEESQQSSQVVQQSSQVVQEESQQSKVVQEEICQPHTKDVNDTLKKSNIQNVINSEQTHKNVVEMLNILFTHINEGKNIDLTYWINHHLSIGFKHVYILNIGSRLKTTNFPKELVTIINSKKDISLENLMKQSYSFSKKYNFEWMLYLRYNEYLYIKDGNINLLLEDKKEFDQVFLSNRSIINLRSVNVPNKFNNYYVTFSNMSKTFLNSDLNNYVITF